MAPILLLAFALLAQDAPPAINDDGPVATAAPRKQDVAPLPIQGGRVTPPTDDYGYVGWCFGAVSGYVDLYDRAMPEVIRIERAWPTPGTEENIKTVYPAQKRDAARSLELFRRAIEAAEKASPSPIASQGAAAIKKGRGVWTGAGSVPKAQLAQFWMSWSPPARCEETARALEARSNLFGQALTANTGAAAPVVAEPEAEAPTVETAAAEDAPAEAAAMAPAETPAPAEDVEAVEAVAESTVIDAPEGPAEASAVDVAEAPAAEAEEASAIDGLLPEPAEAQPMAAVAPPVVKPATPPAAAPARPASEAKPGLRGPQ